MSKKAKTTALVKPMDKLKAVLSVESVQQQFRNALAENAGAFTASIIDLYGSDNYLQQCDPNQVVMEAQSSNSKLPINKQLACLTAPRRRQALHRSFKFYKGYIQLAMHSQYRRINADAICEGRASREGT